MLFPKKELDFSSPRIMGIINLTPDSFFDGNKFFNENNSQGYDIAHQQETFILDKDLKLQVRWSGADWPLDLFMEDLQSVIKM